MAKRVWNSGPGYYKRYINTDDADPNAGGMSHHYVIVQQWDDRSTDGAERSWKLDFQHGPVKEVGHNGIQHADLYRILIDRLEAAQAGPFACEENAAQLEHLRAALALDEARTARRVVSGTESTYKGA